MASIHPLVKWARQRRLRPAERQSLVRILNSLRCNSRFAIAESGGGLVLRCKRQPDAPLLFWSNQLPDYGQAAATLLPPAGPAVRYSEPDELDEEYAEAMARSP